MVELKKHLDKIVLGLLLIISAIPRFSDLGYSDFYGDETKVLYVDKTVSAFDFFMNQRKAPLQFIVAWVMEKITGFDELYMRLPFALAGLLAVFVFYLLVREFAPKRLAIFSTLLLSFSGFSLAFSRTVQYQSFLALFGFLGIWLFLVYKRQRKPYLLLLSALSFTGAFYCHYDALFFIAPVIFMAIVDIKNNHVPVKQFLVTFVLPLLLLVGAFYIPYMTGGFFEKNALGYLSRRLVGTEESLQHNSRYTFHIYNPLNISLMFIAALAVVGTIHLLRVKKDLFLLIWFLIPFCVFEFVFKHPGTHILNYFIPMYILAGYGFYFLVSQIKNQIVSKAISGLLLIYLAAFVATQTYIFTPVFNALYPWDEITTYKFIGYVPLNGEPRYQIFLYGFPYYRGWDLIREQMHTYGDVDTYYTNDNAVVAKYYLKEFAQSVPAQEFLPKYFIEVPESQEFKTTPATILDNYVKVDELKLGHLDPVVIYKLKAKTL